jgi:hypothetical protein
VAPVCGDQRIEGWLEVLNSTLYPPNGSRRNSDVAPGCPVFGEDSVLDRGPQGDHSAQDSIRPGLHRSVVDGPSVAWWDPTVLTLEVEEQAALRHQRILEANPNSAAAIASEENYARWKTEREALLVRASQFSVSVQTVTSFVRAQTMHDGKNQPVQSAKTPPVEVQILDRAASSGQADGVSALWFTSSLRHWNWTQVQMRSKLQLS